MDLQNIEALHGRAEDYAGTREYREQFDLCVSRAVANLSTLSEYCLPYVKLGGVFVAYKSGNSGDEIESARNALELLGGELARVVPFLLPNSEITRTLITIRKVHETPKRYPRKAGKPVKKPL